MARSSLGSSRYSKPARALAKSPHLRPVLTALQERFIDEFLVDMDPTAAALRAGSDNPASFVQSVLKSTAVLGAIQTAIRYRATRQNVEQDYVLNCWLELLEVDYREISEHWRVACRYCYGADHRYQLNDHDREEAITAYQLAYEYGMRDLVYTPQVDSHVADQVRRAWSLGKNNKELPPFDDLGGPGYTILKDPVRGPDWVEFWQRKSSLEARPVPVWVTSNEDHSCPACYGFGVPHVMFHDTRTFSKAAVRTYMGVEQTGSSYKVITRNKAEVEQLVARHLGYFVERKMILVSDVTRMSDAELDAAIEDAKRERAQLLGQGAPTFDAETGDRIAPSEVGDTSVEP